MTLAFLALFSPHLIYFKSSASLTTAIYQRAGSLVECVCVCVCVSTTLAPSCGVTDLQISVTDWTSHLSSVLWLHIVSVSPPLSINVFASSTLNTTWPEQEVCKIHSHCAEANKGERHERTELTSSQQHSPGNGFSTLAAWITSFIMYLRNKLRQQWSTDFTPAEAYDCLSRSKTTVWTYFKCLE